MSYNLSPEQKKVVESYREETQQLQLKIQQAEQELADLVNQDIFSEYRDYLESYKMHYDDTPLSISGFYISRNEFDALMKRYKDVVEKYGDVQKVPDEEWVSEVSDHEARLSWLERLLGY